jgi:hypothetical protein
MELGSVTLKRIGFFCFPIKHSTHTIKFRGDNEKKKYPAGLGEATENHFM